METHLSFWEVLATTAVPVILGAILSGFWFNSRIAKLQSLLNRRNIAYTKYSDLKAAALVNFASQLEYMMFQAAQYAAPRGPKVQFEETEKILLSEWALLERRLCDCSLFLSAELRRQADSIIKSMSQAVTTKSEGLQATAGQGRSELWKAAYVTMSEEAKPLLNAFRVELTTTLANPED